MSWKSLVCAGLLCALVTPVSAQPSVTIDLVRSGGIPVLTAGGDWQWRVSINGNAVGSMAASLAFIASGGTDPLVGATGPNTGATQDWDHEIPADDPASFGNFSWLPNEFGTRAAGLDVSTAFEEVQASFGSLTFNPAENSEFILITTNGPNTTNSLMSTLQLGGAYDLGAGNVPIPGNQGLVALEGDNYAAFVGSMTVKTLGGDANLTGDVDGADFLILQNNFNMGAGKVWQTGDFNGTGVADGADFLILQNNFPTAAVTVATALVVTGSSAGTGAGSASVGVPEPASAVLMLMAGSLLLVARLRRR